MVDGVGKGQISDIGVVFGPTASGKVYLCYKEHRGAGSLSNKSQWIISLEDEFDLFCKADANEWKDERNDYWAVSGKLVLGTLEERVAKFWDRNPWHGFPVLTSDSKPSTHLINLWREQGIINRKLEKMLKRGTI